MFAAVCLPALGAECAGDERFSATPLRPRLTLRRPLLPPSSAAATSTQFIEANQFRLLSKDEDFGGLASSNRFVAAAVVDPEAGGKTSKFMKKIKKLARNRPGKSGSPPLAASVRDKFHFMELDGVQWAEFLEQLNVTPDQLPRVVVIDRPVSAGARVCGVCVHSQPGARSPRREPCLLSHISCRS